MVYEAPRAFVDLANEKLLVGQLIIDLQILTISKRFYIQ
jgi:hypothetical protein